MKLTEVILTHDSVVPFTAFTKNYGRAEFQICPVVKRGKLKELFIYPKQQPDAKNFYHVVFGDYPPDAWQVMSWTHLGMNEPKVWLFNWCKEHKCQMISVYVPKQANSFRIHILSTFSIIFEI